MTTPENTPEHVEDMLAETAKQLFDGNADSLHKRKGLHIVYSLPSKETGVSRQIIIEIQSKEDIARLLSHLPSEHPAQSTPIDLEMLKAINPGSLSPVQPIRNDPDTFIGRNDSCPCGSGKKYKKCCSTAK